jgi:hypothetical protein
VAKRPKFSRWRRLPGVFRTGDRRPPEGGTELDRIILYVPARILDLAEVLAEKEGVPTVQDYCALLLMQSIENERIKQKVADFEARRGPLEGLKQIANDPDYLAEWQERSDSKEAPASAGASDGAADPGVPLPGAALTVDVALSEREARPPESAAEMMFLDEVAQESAAAGQKAASHAAASLNQIDSSMPTVVKMTEQSSLDVVARHVRPSDDPHGFLPCLRRGEAVPANKAAELIFALNQLEAELKDAAAIDRRTAHALHRLALESQVLLTDAWPGRFDERMIMGIRTVQESVERILSGEDIRYYPTAQAPGSERPR